MPYFADFFESVSVFVSVLKNSDTALAAAVSSFSAIRMYILCIVSAALSITFTAISDLFLSLVVEPV